MKKLKIQDTLNELASHRISIEKAAAECEVSIEKMLELSKEKNIDWTGYSKEDLERDLDIVK